MTPLQRLLHQLDLKLTEPTSAATVDPERFFPATAEDWFFESGANVLYLSDGGYTRLALAVSEDPVSARVLLADVTPRSAPRWERALAERLLVEAQVEEELADLLG